MNIVSKLLITATLASASTLSMAADSAHGKALQQKNCMSCHDDGVYTRKERKITSLTGLDKQVRRCELSLGLQWFDDDVEDVVSYLNESFYKFE